MRTAHEVVAVGAVLVALAASLTAAAAYWRSRRVPGALVAHLLALAQTVLVAQVGLGLLLLSGGRRAGDTLHYAYGTLALGAVLSPWLYAPPEPRRRLAWFGVATLLAAALGVRALMTGG